MNLEPCTVCQAPGAWICAKCGAKCAEHVRRRRGPRLRHRCAEDGEDAELQRRPRAELHPLAERVRLAALGPISDPRVTVATLLVTVLFFSARFLGAIGAALAIVATVVLGLEVTRTTLEGEAFDWPAPADAMERLVLPLARALAAALLPIVVVFVGVQLMVLDGYEADTHRGTIALTLASHPSFWIAALVAVATVPFMLLSAVRHDDWGTVFNPLAALLPVRHHAREYGWASLFAGAGFLATFLISWAMPFRLPTFGALVTAVIASYAAFATFRLLGEIGWLHPEALGNGDANDALEDLDDPGRPMLEDAAPAPMPSSSPAPVPIAVVPTEAQLVAALDNHDLPSVIDRYRALSTSDVTLSPSTLLRAGQAAASANELALAVKALLAAGRGDEAASGKALVIAARILDERMRDPEAARRLYQQVSQRFEGSQAADFARRQLADPRFLLTHKG